MSDHNRRTSPPFDWPRTLDAHLAIYREAIALRDSACADDEEITDADGRQHEAHVLNDRHAQRELGRHTEVAIRSESTLPLYAPRLPGKTGSIVARITVCEHQQSPGRGNRRRHTPAARTRSL